MGMTGAFSAEFFIPGKKGTYNSTPLHGSNKPSATKSDSDI